MIITVGLEQGYRIHLAPGVPEQAGSNVETRHLPCGAASTARSVVLGQAALIAVVPRATVAAACPDVTLLARKQPCRADDTALRSGSSPQRWKSGSGMSGSSVNCHISRSCGY